ncbi:MAG: hypothetical protein H6670_12195 [Anaerolineaceae bacterium]|nr:hypothetical protein [Anaerolineaceae bacterium]
MPKRKNESINLTMGRLIYGVTMLALVWSLFGVATQIVQHLISPTVQPNDLHDTTVTLATLDPFTAQRSETNDHFAALLFDAVGTDITVDWSGVQLFAYVKLPVREPNRYRNYLVSESQPLHIELDLQQRVSVCLSEAPLSDPFDPQNPCPELQARYTPPNTLHSLTVATDHASVISRIILNAGKNFLAAFAFVGVLALMYKLIDSDACRRRNG